MSDFEHQTHGTVTAADPAQDRDDDAAGEILSDLVSNRYEPEARCRADVQPNGEDEYPWARNAGADAERAMWL